jgi:hypothetical protein
MKAKSFLHYFLIFIAPFANGQIIKDKISQPEHVLKGTTVLKASERNMNSRWVHGLWLADIKSSECLQSKSESPAPTLITSVKEINDSTLIITVNINENCSYDFLGEIEVVSDNTLNLIYHGYGGYAECSCDFCLTYQIELVKDGDYKFDKLKYVTVNNIAKSSLPKISTKH